MRYLAFLVLFVLCSCASNNDENDTDQVADTDNMNNLSDYPKPKDPLIRSLPEELYPYEENILSSKRDFINITLNKVTEIELVKKSKVGGYPYFPKDMDYPTNEKGEPLDFLAQINFSEIPELEGYPTSGMVQFYLALDDLYGMDFDDPYTQKNYRVVYHKNLDKTSRTAFPELDAIRKNDAYLSPKLNHDVFEMVFNKDSGYVPGFSIHFAEYFGEDTWPFFESFGDKEDEIAEAYMDIISSTGHKIGGYPFFTQEDPRLYDQSIADWVLLFQLDTDGDDIMWGDAGVGNFFISKEALKNLDFSKVYYNWDCY